MGSFSLDGLPAMAGSAIVGGVLLALIEGMGIMFNRFTAEQFKPGMQIAVLITVLIAS